MKDIWDVEDIVLRIQAGDEAAFEELVKKYEKLVYYIALPKVQNQADASDIVQETFIEIKKSITKLKEPKYFKSWLNKIVLSKIARHYEKQKDCVLTQQEEQLLYAQREQRVYMNPQQMFNYQCNREILDRCMRQLKGIYQDVLILQFFEGFTMAEIADILEIPEGTVKSRLSVAKKDLRKIIEATLEAEEISLNFDSVGIEALLVLYFADRIVEVEEASELTTSDQGGNNFKETVAKHPFISALLSATLAIGAIVGVYQLTHTTGGDESSYRETESEDKQRSAPAFPQLIYRGTTITNAREAYTAIYESIMNHNSDAEDYRRLYDTLSAYGGHYADMAAYLQTHFNQK